MSRRIFPWVAVAGLLTLTACGEGSAPAALAPGAAELGATANSVTRIVGNWQVTITDLGMLPGGTYSSAYDINNIGEVVGRASDAAGVVRRVIWQNGVIVDTLPQPGSAVTTATQMNERRQLVGFANQGSGGIGYGVFWDNGTAVKLQPLPGTAASGAAANGLNAAGDVAGGGTGGGGTIPLYQHAGIWRNGLLFQDIGVIPGGNYSMAYDINDAGQVMGTGTAGGTGARQFAFIWANGTFTVLPDLPGPFLQSSGRSINARGDVAGLSNGGEPVVWKNGVVSALPLLTRYATVVSEINDSGDVVGTVGNIGALWKQGQHIPLDPWPNASVNASVARGINNQGAVVGEAYFPAGQGVHAVMWTVAPVGGGTNTPPAVTLAAAGPTSIRVGQTARLTLTFTDPDAGDGPWPYTVSWGTGATTGSAAAPGSIAVSRTYTRAGTFTVRARVTDAHGAAGTSNSITIRVR